MIGILCHFVSGQGDCQESWPSLSMVPLTFFVYDCIIPIIIYSPKIIFTLFLFIETNKYQYYN